MKKLRFRTMAEADIHRVIPLYIEQYNDHEGGIWTEETTYKRIHQVWSREDSLCLLMEEDGKTIGFAMGYFEQYDDLSAYDLVEIVIAHGRQGEGLGTCFMEYLEKQVKALGGSMIQLQAVNDAMHHAFYGKLGYKDCRNLVPKSKFL